MKQLIRMPIIKSLVLSSIKVLEFDRKLMSKQVDRLLRSMMEYGGLRLPVVLENKSISGILQYYTMDGKHMRFALIKAGIDSYPCIIVKCEDLARIVKIMAKLNNLQLPWTNENYVMAFKSLGINDYSTLYTHSLATSFTYYTSASILGTASLIKTGEFKVINKDAQELTDALIDTTNLLGTSSAKFMKAYIGFFRSSLKDKYDHKMFMRKLSVVRKDFQITDDYRTMQSNLEELYTR